MYARTCRSGLLPSASFQTVWYDSEQRNTNTQDQGPSFKTTSMNIDSNYNSQFIQIDFKLLDDPAFLQIARQHEKPGRNSAN